MKFGRAGLALLSVPLSWAILETCLQVGSIINWKLTQPSDDLAATEGTQRVLCVGDSYTFGIGASTRDRAYPKQLEGVLNDRSTQSWQVRNGGWAGQNSREVLGRLPGQLREWNPHFVCVLVGTNDGWSLPELLEADESSSAQLSWSLRVRSIDFLRLLYHNYRGTVRADQPTSDRAAEPARPRSGSTRPFAQYQQAMRKRNFKRALAIVDQILEADAASLQAHRMKAQVFVRIGDFDAADAEIDWLRANFEANPRQSAAEAWMAALATREGSAAYWAHAEELARKYPESGQILRLVAIGRSDAGDLEGALTALERAFKTASGGLLEVLLTLRATLLVREDPVRATADLLHYLEITGRMEPLKAKIGKLRGAISEEQLNELIGDRSLDPEAVVAVQSLWSRPKPKERPAFYDVLETHTVRILGTCREYGAEPLLLTYPFWKQDHRDMVLRLGAEHGIAVVDNGKQFLTLLESHERDELFVADGHCTDRGYAAVAELVADAILNDE